VARTCPGLARVSDDLVRQVRTGQHDPKTARVVLDLEAPTNFRVFPLYAPARVVIDVFRATRGPDVVASIIAGSKPPRPKPEAQRLRIAVDAGHGGKDPGAVGPKGLKEKDVTLAIAKELGRSLRATLRCEVKLTRDRDVFRSLEERTAIANAFGADLFISVHVNANRSPRAEGIETYYLDRASDRAARRLAARENASGETDLAEIEHILKDVLLTSKIRESRRLAKTLQAALVSGIAQAYGSVRDLGVKRGPFYVLTGAAMPAVLVETSFITHPRESKRLRDAAYLRTTAQAMAKGVERFVEGG
jgi:N-acetylmuramoyl-L-alanine amidase